MKRNKKSNSIQNKQESQHLRNLFYKKIQQILVLLGDDSALSLLDRNMLESLYQNRVRPYKIIGPNDIHIKDRSKVISMMNKSLSNLLNETIIEVSEQKIKFSVYDFAVHVETIYYFLARATIEQKKIVTRLKITSLMFSSDFLESRARAREIIIKVLEIIAWNYSDLTTNIIRFVPEEKKSISVILNKFSVYNNYILEAKKAEPESIEIDGNRRTIYKVCASVDEEFIPLTFTPEKMGLKGFIQNHPIVVYIQKHALERIEIRLGKSFRLAYYPLIINDILNAVLVPADEKNGFLLPVTIDNIRLGYLKADMMNNKLIIRTFLFITNNGTPEGKRLNQMLGLQKADKNHLGIDKLSTFLQSDIKNDENLKAIFCEAGCGELFNLDKNLLGESGNKEIELAQIIKWYLKK